MSELTCTKCNQPKKFEDFYKNGSSKRGYSAKCKLCLNAETYVRSQISKAKREEGKRRQQEGVSYGPE